MDSTRTNLFIVQVTLPPSVEVWVNKESFWDDENVLYLRLTALMEDEARQFFDEAEAKSMAKEVQHVMPFATVAVKPFVLVVTTALIPAE